MKSIAIINFKGGVGKTTISYLLGTYLASIGRKTLLCDIDPQMSLTQVFGIQKNNLKKFSHLTTNVDSYTKQNPYSISNLADLVKYYMNNDQRFPKGVNNNTFIKLEENLSVLPSSTDLYGIEFATKYDDVMKQFFRDLLPMIPTKYKSNYIIFDCPPNFTPFTYSALYAADLYLIPVQPDIFGPRAVSALYDFIENKAKLGRNKKTKYLILFSRVKTNGRVTVRESSNNITSVVNWRAGKENVDILRKLLVEKACFRVSVESMDLNEEVKESMSILWNEIEKNL